MIASIMKKSLLMIQQCRFIIEKLFDPISKWSFGSRQRHLTWKSFSLEDQASKIQRILAYIFRDQDQIHPWHKPIINTVKPRMNLAKCSLDSFMSITTRHGGWDLQKHLYDLGLEVPLKVSGASALKPPAWF